MDDNKKEKTIPDEEKINYENMPVSFLYWKLREFDKKIDPLTDEEKEERKAIFRSLRG